MPKTVTHLDNIPYFGDEELLKIAANRNFAAMIFELLSGNAPKENELKLFELILNISIDHGPDTPSAAVTIAEAKDGKTISESVAAGILQINDVHGGAIEPAMKLFYKINDERLDPRKVVTDYLEEDKKIPGFGHRIYDEDPRANAILDAFAANDPNSEGFLQIIGEMGVALNEKKGRPIPINVDGAIAAVLCGFDWPAEIGKALFIIARTPGLVAQYLHAKHRI